MSGSHARLLGLAFVAVLAATMPLRAQDYFEQKKRELALQAQQTAADVQAALATSRKLEKDDPAAAKALLSKRLLEVNDSVALEDKQRADLQKRLRDRLKEVEATAREMKASGDAKSKADAERAALEEREKMEKAKIYGQSSYDQVKGRVDDTKKILENYDSIKATREKNITDMQVGAEKTFAKGGKEERITQYFIDKSEKRKGQKLTKEEAALLKALNSTLSVDFNRDSLKTVLEYLNAKAPEVNIFLDEASLKEVGVEDYSTTPITFKAKKVTLRMALKKIFGDLQLTYIIKDATIQVMTPERAKNFTVTRAYPVQDLIAPFDNLKYNPYAQQAIMAQQAQQLMAMIVNSIEPSSWQGMSERGFGTIFYDAARMSIVIRHTAEMHYMLGGGLSR